MSDPSPGTSGSGLGPDGIRRWALALLVLAAIPDVLPYAGLKSLIGERFGKSDAETQLFAVAALLGALFAVPLLRYLRQKSPRRVFAVAALVQAFSVGIMALPISWEFLLALRCIQGGADLLTLVTLTTVVASHARGTGRGFGASGSAVLFGLAIGLAGGGVLSSLAPLAVFPLCALVSLLMALAAAGLPALHVSTHRPTRRRRFDRQIILGGAFAASDRMISGMMTVSFPLLLVATMGLSESIIGAILAAPLLACAFGGFFSGMLIDRIGGILGRAVGVPLQAVGLGLIVLSSGQVGLLIIGTVLLAVGATILLPTAMVIGTSRRTDQVEVDAVGGIQAIGQGGHLFGVLLIGLLTVLAGQVTTTGIVLILGAYLAWNGVFLYALRDQTASNPRPGPQFPLGARQLVGPRPARTVRTNRTALIEPLVDTYDGPRPDPNPKVVDEECPSTNTNASKTVNS
ncbi:MAG: MFS transporter [Planctomycetota bacterium]|nr:MFS transporter [Planctomycetota bacterium]